MRDLRRLDFTINPNEEFTVQVRQHVVLFTADPLRAVVTNKKMRLIVPPGGDMELSILQHYIQALDQSSQLNQRFELYMYEYLLSSLKDLLLIKQETLTNRVKKYIKYLRSGAVLSPKRHEIFYQLKDQSFKFQKKLKTYDSSLRQIINDDETLALMNLTTLQTYPRLYK